MNAVQVKKISFDDLVHGVINLNETELTNLFDKINELTLKKKPTLDIQRETILLKQIKEIIPQAVVSRYEKLNSKETLTEQENKEILQITDFFELKSAERIPLLAELAKIRQVPIMVLVRQLDLKNFHG